jgi:hypothetical protein
MQDCLVRKQSFRSPIETKPQPDPPKSPAQPSLRQIIGGLHAQHRVGLYAKGLFKKPRRPVLDTGLGYFFLPPPRESLTPCRARGDGEGCFRVEGLALCNMGRADLTHTKPRSH